MATGLGDADGFGRYGVLDEAAEGLLCHECGRRFVHLGVHVFKAHGMHATTYRDAHGLSRRGLVASGARAVIAENARERMATKPQFVSRRDPVKASLARTGNVSAAGREAMRQANASRRGRGRLGTVVVCGWCGVEFCPLEAARKRRFCSRSCASRYTRLGAEARIPGGPVPRLTIARRSPFQ